MLNRVLAKLRPTPGSAMTVSLLALIVALGSSGYAANGGAFILGVFNSATQGTGLGANYNGTALALGNSSAGASATALTLSVAAGHPPMKVNTVTKVTNLNADYVDGLDSKTLTRVMRVNYNLGPLEVSAPITVPPNVPVLLVGVNVTTKPGLGQTSLHRVPGVYMQYLVPGGGVGISDTQGTLIVYLGPGSGAVVEVASPDTIQIHNVFNGPVVTGNVTLMW